MGSRPVVSHYFDTLKVFAFRLVFAFLFVIHVGKLRKVCAANRACPDLARLFSRMANKARLGRMAGKAYSKQTQIEQHGLESVQQTRTMLFCQSKEVCSKQSQFTWIVAAYGCSIRLSMIAWYAFEYSQQAQITRMIWVNAGLCPRVCVYADSLQHTSKHANGKGETTGTWLNLPSLLFILYMA